MNDFTLRPSKVFLRQVCELSESDRHFVAAKLELAKLNPFRYKSLNVPGVTKVFEIKLTLAGLYSRLIYSLEGKEIRVECIINRKRNFKDLMKLLFEARKSK